VGEGETRMMKTSDAKTKLNLGSESGRWKAVLRESHQTREREGFRRLEVSVIIRTEHLLHDLVCRSLAGNCDPLLNVH
jgi:hypothetical protein